MSDTPRTDAAISDAWMMCGVHVVSADFARSLERELNASKDQDRIANILSTVTDTPETDAFLTAENCRRDNPVAFDWLVGFARSLERKAANAYKGYRACNDDLIKCDEEVMRWFKAASPYATPGSLEQGLKKLQGECSECRRMNNRLAKIDKELDALGAPTHEQVDGLTMELSRVGRIKRLTCLCLSFPHACPVHRGQDGSIDSTVKPSAWD